MQPALRELVEERWERVVEGGGPSWNEIVGEEGEGKGLVAGCGKVSLAFGFVLAELGREDEGWSGS